MHINFTKIEMVTILHIFFVCPMRQRRIKEKKNESREKMN